MRRPTRPRRTIPRRSRTYRGRSAAAVTGIQDDSEGNLIIDEDIGGSNKPGTKARQPNSYLFRYVPKNRVTSSTASCRRCACCNESGEPITFASQEALNSPDQVALHTYGKSFKTRWITIHDTATEGNAPFVAGPLAKAAGATPFKRPENGASSPAPASSFFFDETGDTNKESVENPTPGAGGRSSS